MITFRIITTARGHDYAPGFLLDYPYFKKHYKMMTINLSK